MSIRREPVTLALSGDFVGGMAAAAKTAKELSRRWALDDATWEPHDWDEW
jgi:hypothetical protein